VNLRVIASVASGEKSEKRARRERKESEKRAKREREESEKSDKREKNEKSERARKGREIMISIATLYSPYLTSTLLNLFVFFVCCGAFSYLMLFLNYARNMKISRHNCCVLKKACHLTSLSSPHPLTISSHSLSLDPLTHSRLHLLTYSRAKVRSLKDL
jgi:hypothetical protein